MARVLCLHGYAQSAAFFRQRTGAFRKALKSEVGEFTFVDGTHPSTAAFVAGESADGDRGEKLGWWNVAEPDSRPAISSAYVGVEESLEHLENVCKTQGPFDGVLGFSQGATLAALLPRGRADGCFVMAYRERGAGHAFFTAMDAEGFQSTLLLACSDLQSDLRSPPESSSSSSKGGGLAFTMADVRDEAARAAAEPGTFYSTSRYSVLEFRR